jgi:hypothetical protein
VTSPAEHLLLLVLDRVAQTWRDVHAEATGRFGPAPTSFIVQQCAGADWDKVRCLDPVVRCWVYDQNGTVEREPTPAELAGVTSRTGMCFATGRVWFHLAPETNRVVFTFMAGPRFGRGMVLRAEGETLLAEPVPMWVS